MPAPAKAGSDGEATVQHRKGGFLGCYVIRKLSDTVKITDATKDMAFRVTRFANVSTVSYWNWHHLNDAYDLDHGTQQQMKLPTFCNQVMHSFVFIVAVPGDEGDNAGVFVSSDRSRNKELFFVPLSSIPDAFERVGRDSLPKSHRSPMSSAM